jgi:hypothetical protein
MLAGFETHVISIESQHISIMCEIPDFLQSVNFPHLQRIWCRKRLKVASNNTVSFFACMLFCDDGR